jgi:multiple sugar transport system permease protein
MTTTTTSTPITVSLSDSLALRLRSWQWFRPIYLLLAAWLVCVLGPYIWMFITSITPSNELVLSGSRILPANPTFRAYADLIANSDFPIYAFNSIIVAIGTVILTTFIALRAGTALSRYTFKGKTAVLYAILLVQLFPTILLITPLYIELKTFGLLNSRQGLILVYTAFSLSFAIWLMKGFIDQIPVEIEEAALIDGCSPFQAFIHVILPLARPGIAAVATYAFIYSWNEFLFALTFTSSNDARTLPVGLRLFIGENTVHWEDITAGGVLAAIPILIGFMFAQRALISGMTSGAVKG